MPTISPVEVQYWDSCVFIAYLRDHPSQKTHVDEILNLLQQAEHGRIRVVTSTLAVAEVRPYADKYDAARMEFIEDLFLTNRPWFKLVALTRHYAGQARTIAERNRNLQNTDAIHIATAIEEHADVLFTMDGFSPRDQVTPSKLLAWNGKIGDPPLRIELPKASMGPLIDRLSSPAEATQ